MSLLKDGIESGTVVATEQAVKHTIDGVTQTFRVYRIRTDQLYYNNHNDRIATWLSQYRAEHDGSDPIDLPRDEYNAIIQQYIVDSNPEKIRGTQKNIAAFGQRVAGVVLDDGRVIDGNRRLTCIMRIAEQKHEVGWFEAAILPDSISCDPKRIKLLELSIQHGEEGKLDYDPIERLVGIYNDILKDGLLTKAEYAKHTGMTESEVQKLIDQANYMRDFLEFCNAPEQYHLARELAIAGPLGEISTILNKTESPGQRQQVKEYIFANIVAQPEGDITRFVRKFRKVIGTDESKGFLGEESTAFQRLILALGEQPVTAAKVREIRGDDRLVGGFRNAMEKADRKVKLGKMVNAPVAKSKEALSALQQIMPSMMQRMEWKDLEELEKTLEAIERYTVRLLDEVDKLA